jgi:hypothetical protein
LLLHLSATDAAAANGGEAAAEVAAAANQNQNPVYDQ